MFKLDLEKAEEPEIKSIGSQKTMTSLDSIKKQKQRHYFADKVMVHLVKAMVFPVVMYGCESWTIKKAES